MKVKIIDIYVSEKSGKKTLELLLSYLGMVETIYFKFYTTSESALSDANESINNHSCWIKNINDWKKSYKKELSNFKDLMDQLGLSDSSLTGLEEKIGCYVDVEIKNNRLTIIKKHM